MNRLQLAFLTFLFGIFTLTAQQSASYTNDTSDFDRAIALYKEKQYQAARIIFEKVQNKTSETEIKSDCAYYIANCAIKLNQAGAENLMGKFVEDYPTSIKRNDAYLEVGQHYFEQGDYAKSLEWLDKADHGHLSGEEKDRYNFQRGYVAFVNKDKKQAEKYFNSVVKSEKYGAQAKYYLGYLAYEGDDYTKATKLFNEVSEQDQYKGKLSYYQADMSFKTGDFQKAIEQGKAQLTKSNAQEKSEINKIIGESYFNLGQYAEAIPYLT